MAQVQKSDWELFLNECRLELPGSSDMGIKQALFRVLEEFCDDSSAWLEKLSIPVIPSTTQYTMTPSDGGYIIQLQAVFDSSSVPIAAFMPDDKVTDPAGPFAQGLLQLVHAPNNNQIYTVFVSKGPILPTSEDDIPGFSDHIFKRYRRYFVDGVVGRMQMQMNKTYSAPQQGQTKWNAFRQGVQSARNSVSRQNTKGAQGWAFPQAFRSRGQRGGVSVADPSTFN